ncbi:DUF4352 domain-containing protein [Enterococcus faecalis]|uniref:DUF4352 domain-containing protein n=1 Tax=Enterococcus TaxID=1350 RepID=UPI001F2C8E00|nr:DUF4352 domain-containing protein [Enterococcus faecalis]
MVACGNKETPTKSKTMDSTTQLESKSESSTKYAQGLELSLGEIQVSENGESKDKNILSIKIKAKNLNSDEMGFGSNDFVLKNGKDTIKPYADGVNFGEGIKKDQKFEGTMTFEVSKSLKKATLVYRPYEKELATWEIKF